ncbi:hypothetical protein, partial [Treponema sp. R6D11]
MGSASATSRAAALDIGTINANYYAEAYVSMANDTDFFKFVAGTSGTYYFNSAFNTLDTYGFLYNSSGTQLTYNDDSAGTKGGGGAN